jgi:hypothetical protein
MFLLSKSVLYHGSRRAGCNACCSKSTYVSLTSAMWCPTRDVCCNNARKSRERKGEREAHAHSVPRRGCCSACNFPQLPAAPCLASARWRGFPQSYVAYLLQMMVLLWAGMPPGLRRPGGKLLVFQHNSARWACTRCVTQPQSQWLPAATMRHNCVEILHNDCW